MEELHPEPGEAPEPAETDGGGSAGAGARASSKLETRAALIRAALSEFGERGFDAPSLDAICARAGYTRGAFYVHFRSRDELVSAAMEWVLGALLDAVIGPDATSADLSQTIDLYVGLSTRGRSRLDEEVDDDENGGELAGMPLHQVLEACERAPAVRERLRRMLGDAMRRLTTVVESERKRQGVREDVEASEISSLLLLLALGLRVATADQRPARFLRVEKAVSIPDDDVRDFRDTAFGPNNSLGMREIVAYAPIEPDGSVRVKVPADVALAVTVLDSNGRRISGRHNNWIQVLPGQEVTCTGCHATQSGLSHGRSDSFTSVYPGSQNTGVPFPNTVATLSPDFGETMAETRTRVSCQTDCAALEPSLDLVYEDFWTDPAVRAPDAMFEYTYAGLSTPPPTVLACVNSWSATCRSVINYELNIHPLWSWPRQVIDPLDGVTVLADHTCTQGGCHAPVDAMGQVAVPQAQLNLTDGLSPQQMDQFNAYRELLFDDDAEVVSGGAIVDQQIQTGVDAMGNPIISTVTVPASMSAAGANASNAFFSRFDAGGTHAGYLSPDELRLIAEWLDIGAQYYNNPFDAPVN